MRILTWNINGIRTIPQYHPWNTMKTHDDILNLLQADIICFQGTRFPVKRVDIDIDLASHPPITRSFSFPLQKHGYSGVAVYARADSVLPRKAEEGLTGLLQPKPPLSAAERVSVREAYPDEMMAEASSDLVDFRSLDNEGRALVVDFGLFVLVNVYCPNDGTETEERLRYKMDFHRMLEARVKGLIDVEKRQVIVVGDLNACAAVIDHCEGNLMVARGQAEGLQGEDGFWERDVRRWLRSWLISDEPGTTGCLVDAVRRFWPDRKGMYTCWNTKISARESNYGTRIDYILVTPGLLPWIKAADIQPEIKGSDHCPVFIDFHDEIVDSNGDVVKLRDVLGPPSAGGAEPPRIAAKFWDEYKQRLLDTFFGKKTATTNADLSAKAVPLQPQAPKPKPDTPTPLATLESEGQDLLEAAVSSTAELLDDRHSSASQPRMSSSKSLGPAKRKRDTPMEPVASSSSKKPKKDTPKPKKAGQTSLASFFSNASSSKTKISTSASSSKTKPSEADLLDADYKLALSLSQELESASPPRSQSNVGETKKAWSTLLAPIEPPLCQVHGEPTKELTVNKPGPNKGKNFFICSRPVGPGYDRGKAERLREEVDPTWRCDFFKWASEVRLEMTRKKSTSARGGGPGFG
ncbi:DNA-(Apurinic or apyrimidinic site) lyase 2 [Mycena venus]|uniref:DNA-(apurinic or apyrimidinic site) endonuclease n=1 Tax=Mycena venus TaxID=2733690 RepID=A0A8H7CRN3_9AGAR|nr:DNA-(Apurinic or apyrimidinic site) lyase 2 [Mycena venus]